MRIEVYSDEDKFNLDTISFGQRVVLKEEIKTDRPNLKEHTYLTDYELWFPKGNRYLYIKSIEDGGVTYCLFSEGAAYDNSTLVLSKERCEELLEVKDYIYAYKRASNLLYLFKSTFLKIDMVRYEANKSRILGIFDPLAKSIYGEDNYTFSEHGGTISFFLKFPKIIVSNRDKAAKLIRDLCIKFKFNCLTDSPIMVESIQGARATYTKSDWESYYRHSHLEVTRSPNYTNFCLGESALVQLSTRLRSNFDEAIFEAFLSQLPEHMAYESIEGTPYIKLLDCLNHKKASGSDIEMQANLIAKDLLSNPESKFDSKKIIKDIKLLEDCSYLIDFHTLNEVKGYLMEVISSNITITRPYSTLLGDYVEVMKGYEKASTSSDKIEWGNSFIPVTRVPTEDIDIQIEAMSIGVISGNIDASSVLQKVYFYLLTEIRDRFNKIKNKYKNEYNNHFQSNIKYGSLSR